MAVSPVSARFSSISPESQLIETSSQSSTEQYTIVDVGSLHGNKKKNAVLPAFDEGPLIDRTAALTLVSKKTKRLEKQQLKKQHRRSNKHGKTTLLDLPAELLFEILTWLRPSDLLNVVYTSRAIRNFIRQHENQLGKRIIRNRYHVLSRCFPLPVLTSQLNSYEQSVLLDKQRPGNSSTRKKYYQHIPVLDVQIVCSCSWCVTAWDNLCLILDLAHFQTNLDTRTPLPIIPYGANPEWNVRLLERHASTVQRAVNQPLVYATILERHLRSITGTFTRKHLMHRHVMSASGKMTATKETFLQPVFKVRPYQLTDAEADLGDDFFLERLGKPCWEFPFHRDKYYNLEVYIPNRKWVKEQERWLYYAARNHDEFIEYIARDITWMGMLSKRWNDTKGDEDVKEGNAVEDSLEVEVVNM